MNIERKTAFKRNKEARKARAVAMLKAEQAYWAAVAEKARLAAMGDRAKDQRDRS